MTTNRYRQRIETLRSLMKESGIHAYLIVSSDFHASEYVGDYFKCRAYMSGFTGSAGTLAVTMEEAALWTDGRYFLQAADQLADTGILLQKMGEPGVPTFVEWIASRLEPGQTLGYDGRTIEGRLADILHKALDPQYIRFMETEDLVGRIWTDRPAFPAAPIWILEEKYTGRSRKDKLDGLRRHMADCRADRMLIAGLDDIAWLFNIRGGDIAFNPVPMAYALIGFDKASLYVSEEAVTADVRKELAEDGVEIRPYFAIYEDLRELPEYSSLLLDRSSCNVALLAAVPAGVGVIHKSSWTTLQKAVKNPVEAANIRRAHIRDGAAVTKLLYWLDQIQDTGDYKEGRITELDVAARLLQLRRQQDGFLDQSFAPIIAAGSHGAIVHYDPDEDSNIPLVHNSFLLMDTGGQYLQGTTDITRTAVLGTVTDEMKEHYTAVLRGNLDLAGAVFHKGCSGIKLDTLARLPLWEKGLDFNHGTGHGVGYLLNVHEGPHRIAMAGSSVPFEPGMVTSDEPGLYLAGRYGIRLENLMLCVPAFTTDQGEFYRFETLTMVPFDRRAILADRLSGKEKKLLNAYHAAVFKNISPYLTLEECVWLKEMTAPV